MRQIGDSGAQVDTEVDVLPRIHLALAVMVVSLASALTGLASDHPVPLENNDPAQCASCHEEKTKGKSVHAAIAMGCNTCHDVKVVEKEKTTVELVQPKNELCFTCHEKSADPVKHAPYEKGNCTLCHDPHQSDFDNHLRARTNDLCMSCHALDRPDVKWNPDTKTVTLLGEQTLTRSEYMEAKKIGLDKNNPKGHPMMGHPVSGTDPRDKNKKTELTCLSCHQPHASKATELMAKNARTPLDICGQCHQ